MAKPISELWQKRGLTRDRRQLESAVTLYDIPCHDKRRQKRIDRTLDEDRKKFEIAYKKASTFGPMQKLLLKPRDL